MSKKYNFNTIWFNYNQHIRIINKYRYIGFVYKMHINLDSWITLILEKRKSI